jgi:hypothetical protein
MKKDEESRYFKKMCQGEKRTNRWKIGKKED